MKKNLLNKKKDRCTDRHTDKNSQTDRQTHRQKTVNMTTERVAGAQSRILAS